MKINKRGYTLIEVISVIVILSLMGLIVQAGVTKIVKKSKNDLTSVQEKLLISAGEVWAAQNMDSIPSNGCTYVTLNELIESSLINNVSMIPDSINKNYYYVVICSQSNGQEANKLTYSTYDNSEYIGCFEYYNSSTSTITIYSYNDSITKNGNTVTCPRDVFIPNTISKKSVTSIAQAAFYQKQLTSVVIPNSVTSIGNNAFCYNNLTSVIIPDSITSLGNQAFCSNNLTSVVIPNSVTSIDGTFMSNQLTSVTIPDSVTSIGGDAFWKNQLTSVTIPDSVTSIGYNAFFGNQLTNVTIPDSVTSIGNSAFNNNKLTSVRIGSGIVNIGNFAFMHNKLTSVTIPDSVTSIGSEAFSCNKLTSVRIGSGIVNIGEYAFIGGFDNRCEGYPNYKSNQITSFIIDAHQSDVYVGSGNDDGTICWLKDDPTCGS